MSPPRLRIAARVAIAGFQHETNTFAPMSAEYGNFVTADIWPGLLHGDAVIEKTRGMNLPIAGIVSCGEEAGVDLVPLLWCSAEPSAQVSDDAFDRIAAEIITGLETAGTVKGLCLDLHGAMVTQSHDDGEAELLRRIRARLGFELPIAVSLDLHANVSQELVNLATSLAVYRTYPHLDMAGTGSRAMQNLLRHLDGWKPHRAFRQVPYLISLPAQNTGKRPARDLYDLARKLSEKKGISVELALGFTAGDVSCCGAAIVSHASTSKAAEAAADEMLSAFMDAEPEFVTGLLPPEAAVEQAMANSATGPVIIADVQDNAGAGATSDTTGLLTALVAAGAENTVIGMICDREVASMAHRLGPGAEFSASLGGKFSLPGQPSFEGRFRVEALGDGRCEFTGEMSAGCTGEFGPCTVLRILEGTSDIRVVVSTNRIQCIDLAQFTHLGIDPRTCNIVAVKSTVHYRADFEPIASVVLEAACPGSFPCQLEQVPYRNLRDGVRLGPRGKPFRRSLNHASNSAGAHA